MARVNVEQMALSDQTDPRFKILGRALGVDRWSALGRMIAVWNLCQERETYVLNVGEVNSLFDDVEGMSDALLKSGLGKKHRHGIYISGSRGRVEWLANKRRAGRENGKLGGRPPVTKAEPIDNQDRLRVETPLALSPAPALSPAQKKKTPTESKKKSAKELVEGLVVDADLRAYARQFGHDADVLIEDWRDHFRSNGYLVGGKTPIQDANASFRRWIRNARVTTAQSSTLFKHITKAE